MFAVITTIIIIWICMWIFYKFMYPRAPKSMMPKKGDVTTPRNCDFCGHSLAEYRGVLETKSTVATTDSQTAAATIDSTSDDTTDKSNELFFCNYEHQADYHAGKVYQ